MSIKIFQIEIFDNIVRQNVRFPLGFMSKCSIFAHT